MGKVVLVVSVESGNKAVGDEIFRILQRVASSHFGVMLKRFEKTDNVFWVETGGKTEFGEKLHVFLATMQTAFLMGAAAHGWEIRLVNSFARWPLPISVANLVRHAFRRCLVESIVTVMGPDGALAYTFRVGGRMRAPKGHTRTTACGRLEIMSCRNAYVICRIVDRYDGPRRFLVENKEWAQERVGERVFVVLEKVRAGRIWWRFTGMSVTQSSLWG